MPQIVRTLTGASLGVTELSVHVAAQALRLFGGITSADGYEKLTTHLGPDKRVRSSIISVTSHTNKGSLRNRRSS